MSEAARILLAEDSDRDAELVLHELKRAGVKFESRRVQTEPGFRRALSEFLPQLILSDYVMPGFSGIAALRICREAGSDIPFIFVSGTIGEDVAVASMKAGADDYVMKTNLIRLGPTVVRALREAELRQAGMVATENLRESESLKSAIIEASLDCVITIDQEGRVVEFNPAAEATFGIKRGNALGKPMAELIIPPRLRDAHHRGFAHYLATGEAPILGKRLELEAMRADGKEFPIELAITDIRSGSKTLFTAFIRDLTERKRAEEVLRESEARFRSLSQLSSDWFWQQDAEFRFVEFTGGDSPQGWGPDQSAALGLRRWELPGVSPISGSWDEHKAVYEAHQPFRDFEYQHARVDGTTKFISASGEPMFDASGRFSGYRGVATEITKRKRAEWELQRFGKAMDVSPDSIYLTDSATMRFVYLNKTACQRLGYSREELLQKGPQDVFPTPRETIAREFDDVIAAGEPGLIHERLFTRGDGSSGWSELHRRALPTEGGTLIVTIGRDITERKRADEKIRRLSRVHAVLSGINALIVRVSDRDELFREACRIAVDQGGFKMAWIGIVDRAAMKIAPVASAGAEPEFLTLIKDRFSLREDDPLGNTRTARAVREKKAMVSNEIRQDTLIFFSQERQERGIRSMAVLPLLGSDDALGVLALYAGEAGFFDEEELKLLRELAGDIAFAIDHIEKAGRLDYLAYYDQLTGLANRTLFLERVGQSIIAAQQADTKIALAILDIERLRTINDSLGRQAGDALIKLVAERLTLAGGPAGVSRISADHFALVLGTVKGRSEAGRIMSNALRKSFDAPFQIGETEVRVSAKAGVAQFPGDGAAAETLLRNAEVALRKGKGGGERITFHSAEMTARVAESLTLENKLRQALEKEEFVLYYQPKVDLETRHIAGVEALIRWQSPERGLVPPMLFIPLLEETGLILQVGAWALRRATLDHALLLRQGVPAPRIAVNVSAIQLRQRDFVQVVTEAIAGGTNPTAIDVEITESLLMEDVAGNIEKLKALRELGMKISIDDFGTGYSSLGYLARLPVHILKIDRSFIVAMMNNPDTMTLVSTIISLAHSLRLDVVAEGVEQEDQAKMLRLLRCDQMQGYLISKPLPMEELTPLLRPKDRNPA